MLGRASILAVRALPQVLTTLHFGMVSPGYLEWLGSAGLNTWDGGGHAALEELEGVVSDHLGLLALG